MIQLNCSFSILTNQLSFVELLKSKNMRGFEEMYKQNPEKTRGIFWYALELNNQIEVGTTHHHDHAVTVPITKL